MATMLERRRPCGLPCAGHLIYLLAVTVVGVAVAQDESTPFEFTPVAPLGESVEAVPGADAVWTIASCLDTALVRNESLRAERERRYEITGQKYQAVSNALPSIDLGADWARGRDPSFAFNESFGGGGSFTPPEVPPGDEWFLDWLAGFGSLIPPAEDITAQTYYRASANLTWELNPVKLLGAVSAANLGLQQQDELITAAEHQTSEQVIDAYFQIISLAEARRAMEAQYANQAALLELVKMRYELGTAARLDTLQAAVALANIEPQVRSLAKAVRNAGGRLNALMGRDPSAPLAIANELPVEDDVIDAEVAARLAMDRPDLRAADLSTDLLQRQRQVQVADLRPYLNFSGSYGYVGRDVGTLFDDGHDTWNAAVAFTVPVFNGLLTKGLVDETDARIRRTEVETAGQRRLVLVEVREILNNLDTARQNLRAAQLNLERAEEALAESLLMYRLGKASYLEALDAEANHVTARRTMIEARYAVLTLVASLKRAIGHSPATPLAEISGLVAAER
jgi:outer membrane protein